MAYTAAQQTLRLTANDPQVQLAQDVADALNGGMVPSILVNSYRIDPSISLAPFVVIYDSNRKVLASSGILNGKDPMPPSGVFDYVVQHGEDRVTWMPLPKVRIAIVMTGHKKGFVLAGRSLHDVDNSIATIANLLGMLWLFSAAVASMIYLGVWLEYRRRRHMEMNKGKNDVDRQDTKIG